MKMNLKKKLMLGGTVIVVFSMVVSTVIISMVVKKQNQQEALRTLDRAFVVINDDIAKRKTDMLEQTLQVASNEDTGRQVSFIKESGSNAADTTV